MIRKIILYIINILEKFFKKRILIVERTPFLPHNTAALSEYGFWYVGNVFDMSDISYGIAEKGSVEHEETRLVIKILNKLSQSVNISFYDIGANSGYYGILSAFLYKNKIKVYSFEPLLEYVQCIKSSVSLNRLTNLKIFNLGLGDKQEEKFIYLAGSGSTLKQGFSGPNIKNKRKIEIDKLDNIIMEKRLDFPNFIKIDVEGYELRVLEGAKNVILQSFPVLFIEIAYSMRNIGRSFVNSDYEQSFNFLGEIGYQVYWIKDHKLQKFNPMNKPDGVNMYLFLHKNKHENLRKYIINEKI